MFCMLRIYDDTFFLHIDLNAMCHGGVLEDPRRGTTRVSHLSDENPTKILFGILISVAVGIPAKFLVSFPPPCYMSHVML